MMQTIKDYIEMLKTKFTILKRGMVYPQFLWIK